MGSASETARGSHLHPKPVAGHRHGDLKKICQQYFDKWYSLEGEMFFLQREVILRDLQINELTISFSDMKGKFIKPTLKKVSKYENKFAKLQEKAAKFAFANQLKAKDKWIMAA